MPTTQNNVQSGLFCGGTSSTPAVIVWGSIFANLHPHLQNVKLHTQIQFSSVQSLSHVRHFASPWTAARQASLSITNSRSLLKLMSIESVMPSNHLILCCPLLFLPPALGSFQMSQLSALGGQSIGVSASTSVLPMNISFRLDWLDILAVQGILKSLLQHHSSKASILQCSAFFIVQLSHPYMTTGKTIALTRGTFVEVMSLLLNMLS